MSPTDRVYSQTHEWVKIEGTHAVVGITDHAQSALGDITFVELPPIGKRLTQAAECAVVESVKAASDIYAPLSGEITEINTDIETAPEKINSSPYADGWLFKITNFDRGELDTLMDAIAYDNFLEDGE
jgi:glycine cleavage system H protein